MPKGASVELEQWLEDMHSKTIWRCQGLGAEMFWRHLGKALETLMAENPITYEQERADWKIRSEVEAQISKIETNVGTIEGYIERCPGEVPSTGIIEGHHAEGEINSCSEEAAAKPS